MVLKSGQCKAEIQKKSKYGYFSFQRRIGYPIRFPSPLGTEIRLFFIILTIPSHVGKLNGRLPVSLSSHSWETLWSQLGFSVLNLSSIYSRLYLHLFTGFGYKLDQAASALRALIHNPPSLPPIPHLSVVPTHLLLGPYWDQVPWTPCFLPVVCTIIPSCSYCKPILVYIRGQQTFS